MLDDLVLVVEEEVALDGERGCDLSKLWSFVQDQLGKQTVRVVSLLAGTGTNVPTPPSQPTFAPKLDDAMKSYLWTQILEIEELSFYLCEEKKGETEKTEVIEAKKSKGKGKAKGVVPQKPIFGPIKDIKTISYLTLVAKYGNRVRIVASTERQRRAIIGTLQPGQTVSIQMYPVLEAITRNRANGTTQADLAKDLDLDPRSVFHFIKVLCRMNLVVKFPVVTKGTYTNLCLHTRYAKQHPSYSASVIATDGGGLDSAENFSKLKFSNPDIDSAGNVNESGVSYHTDLVKVKVTELLDGARNKVMVAADLMNALGFDASTKKSRKWFNRCLDALGHKGFIEKIAVPRKDKGSDRCVRLLKKFELATTKSKSEGSSSLQALSARPESPFLMDEDEPAVAPRAESMFVDLPFEYQVYRLIKLAGDNGITAGEIQRSLNNVNIRLLHKIFDRTVKPTPKGLRNYGVHRVVEFVGRERRYRYYTLQAWRRVQKEHGFDEEVEEEEVFEDLAVDLDFAGEEDAVVEARAKPKKLGRPRKSDVVTVKAKTSASEEQVVVVGAAMPIIAKKRGRPPKAQESRVQKKKGRPKKDEVEVTKTVEALESTPTAAPEAAFGDDNVDYPNRVEGAPTDEAGPSQATPVLSEQVTPAPKRKGRPPNPTSKSKQKGGKSIVSSALLSEEPQSSTTDNVGESAISLDVASVTNSPPRSITSCSSNLSHKKKDGTGETIKIKAPKRMVEGKGDKMNRTKKARTEKYTPSVEEVFAQPAIAALEDLLCSICAKSDDDEKMLLCDACNKGMHIYCADPPLTAIPEDDWFCSEDCKLIGPLAKDDDIMKNRINTGLSMPIDNSTIVDISTIVEQDVQIEEHPESEHAMTVDMPSALSRLDKGKASVPSKSARKAVVSTSEEPSISTNSTTETSTVALRQRSASSRNSPKKYAPFQLILNANNTTAEKRKKIMLHLLEEHKILEMGHLLIKAYQEAAAKLTPGSQVQHTIDKKTLTRAADDLEEKGLLKQLIVKVPLLNGGYATKTLVLHSSMTRQSPEVVDYIEMIQDRSMLVGNPARPTRAEQHVIEVERLDDMRKRLAMESGLFDGIDENAVYQIGMSTSADSQDASAVQTLETSTEPMLIQTPAKISRSDPASDTWWLLTAQQYGWINAKMMRAKLLHQFLMSLFPINDDIADSPETNSQNRVIQTAMLLRDMPLDLYLKCIGHTAQNQDLTEYIRGGQDMEVKLIDLPSAVRAAILQGNYKFRRHLKQLLDILVALEILRPITTEKEIIGKSSDSSNLSPAYELLRIVKMYDYSMAGPIRDYIREYRLDRMEDMMVFWSELQFLAENTEKVLNSEESLEESQEDEDEEERRPKRRRAKRRQNVMIAGDDRSIDPLKHIASSRNWRSSYLFNTNQRSVLESYVDRKTGKTPYDDDPVCRQLAHQLGLTTQRIKFYFRRVEEMYERRLEAKQARKQELYLKHGAADSRKRKRKGIVTQREGESVLKKKSRETVVERLLKKSAEQSAADERDANRDRKGKEPAEEGSGEGIGTKLGRKSREYVKRREMQRKEGIDDDEPLPVIRDEERFESQYETFVKRTRPQWTPLEDEILVYSYVILRIRARSARFLWAAIYQVLPERSSDICRRRINSLSKNPSNAKRMDSLMEQWEKIYEDALRHGAIEDPNPKEMINFDLKSQLDYFMTEIQSMPSYYDPTPIIPLPYEIQTLHKLFDSVPLSENPEEDFYYEDKYDEVLSLRAKMSILCANSLTVRTNCTNDLDAPEEDDMTAQDHTIEMVKALIKMILTTPEDQYDSAHAFTILNAHPQDVINKALQHAKNSGTIVKIKGGTDRRVPGRGYNISERFLSIMTGNLPHRLFAQATGYHKYLKQLTGFSPLVNSGGMACILNLLAYGKALLKFGDVDAVTGKQIVPNYRSRNIDKRRLDFVVDVVPCSQPTTSPVLEGKLLVVNASRLLTFNLKETAKEAPKRHLHTLAMQHGVEERKLLQVVFAVVEEAQNNGLTITMIKDKLERAGHYINDSAIHRTLSILSSHDPALIMKVGLTIPRFVTCSYLTTWMVRTANRNRIGGREPEDSSSSNKGKSKVSLPDQEDRFSGRSSMKIEFERKPLAPPRMWYDINGTLIDSVFRGCLEAVLGLVLQKPGIYESNIYRKFALVMSRCEVEDVLQHLLDRGAIIRRAIVKPQRVSLFSKPVDFAECSADAIDRNKITCYWAADDYYLKTLI